MRSAASSSSSSSSPSSWLRAVGELVLPRDCVGCGAYATSWCRQCAVVLRADPREVLVVDGVSCRAVAPYRGVAGAAIVAMKERGVTSLVEPLSFALARAVVSAAPGPAPVALVPAPSRPAAVRGRGLDVLAVLARRTASALRATGRDAVAVPALAHRRRVVDQTSLDANARAANLDGALRVRRSAHRVLSGRRVVVVDDVITTGATIAEAVRVLRGVPTDVVGAAAVAGAGALALGESGDRVVRSSAGG